MTESFCGGTIARLVEEGKDVYYMAFSMARTSIRPEYPDNILETEVREATAVLGIAKKHLYIYDLPVRRFPNHGQDILQQIIKNLRFPSPSKLGGI